MTQGHFNKLRQLLFGTPVTPPEPTVTHLLHPKNRDYRVGALFTLLLGALLALNEVNGLARGFVAGGEAAMDFGALSGLRFESVWQFWALPMAEEDLRAWNRLLRCFIVIDLGFIAVYTLILRRIVRAGFVPAKWRGFLDLTVLSLCALDLLEDAGMWIAGNHRVDAGPAGGYEPSPLLGMITLLKWGTVLAILGSFVLALLAKDRGKVVTPWRSALWVQRYSLFAFLPVAALACLPVPKIGDQVPDIERRWLDGGVETWHMAAAVVMTLVVIAPAIFFLGRLRADCAFKRSHDQPTDGRGWPWYYPKGEPREAHLWHWLIAPAIAVVLFGIAHVSDWPTDGKRLGVFGFITVSVPLLSCVVRWRFQERAKKDRYPGPAARQETATTEPAHVMAVGDALAIAAVAAVGLGMMRAWIGLLAVGLSTDDVLVPWQLWLALPLAVIAAVLPWFLAGWVLKRLDVPESPTGRVSQLAVWATPAAPLYVDQDTGKARVTGETSQRVRVLLLAVFGGVFGWMAFDPIGWASRVGVVASVTLALGAAMVLLGVVVAYAQESRPPEILLVVPRPWLSATPIVPFILIGIVTTALTGSPTFVHGIDQDKQEYRAVPTRPTLAEAFTSWADNPSPCTAPDAITVEIDGKDKAFDARPMLILAAEGGGIRATYWTAQGLEEVADAGGTCGQRMTLFSTGASGGSLGLTVGRYDDEPLAAVDVIRGPDSLGAGAIALVTGDLLAASIGVRVGAAPADTDPDGTDRAATMQEVWVEAWDEADTGDGPADHRFIEEDDSALSSVTGHLILTSTDSYDGCRALWSQLDLSPPDMSASASMTDTSNAPGCGTGGAGPNSYDVLGSFGATDEKTDNEKQHCLGNVSALTAGLVSGRFPYVTPSAVVGPCDELTETPLVDGGITDNTGLGTIIDLASQWGPLVRAHNDEVLANGDGALILPMVVYLDNGPATSFGIDQRGGSIAESLIPLWAISAAATRQAPTSALLRQGADAAERFLCSEPSVTTPDADPTACQQLLQQQVPEPQVFVVHQATQPTLSAPLGWVLSNASVRDLTSDMAEARITDCPTDPAASTEPSDPVCLDGHGTLFDLRERLAPFRKE